MVITVVGSVKLLGKKSVDIGLVPVDQVPARSEDNETAADRSMRDNSVRILNNLKR